MLTRKPLVALALLLAGTAYAFDGTAQKAAEPVPQVHADSLAETRAALGAYRAGRKQEAATIFALAAARGHVPAQWKLARMFATGDGVEADPVRAAALYGKIARRFADRDPALRLVPFVADATREAGRMQIEGQAGPRNVRVARRHLWRAATTYRDAEARYLLGRSLLNPEHGRVQAEAAAAWLRSAVALGHAEAGIVFGELQIAGLGTKSDPVAGLLAMARAVERAGEGERATLALRFQSALAKSTEAARVGAEAEIARLNLTVATAPVMEADAAN